MPVHKTIVQNFRNNSGGALNLRLAGKMLALNFALR
jgi:hypothetical protein